MTPVRFEPAAPCLESSTLPLSHCAPYSRKALGVTAIEIVNDSYTCQYLDVTTDLKHFRVYIEDLT